MLAVSIIIGTQLAYVLNRFKFPGNGLIRNAFTFAALLPAVAMQVAVYEIMVNLNFVNTLYGYIIMMCGTDVISIYIFIQYFENLPVSWMNPHTWTELLTLPFTARSFFLF